jgi:hypothetical protein
MIPRTPPTPSNNQHAANDDGDENSSALELFCRSRSMDVAPTYEPILGVPGEGTWNTITCLSGRAVAAVHRADFFSAASISHDGKCLISLLTI